VTYVVGAACHFLAINPQNIDDDGRQIPSDEKAQMLDKVAEQIVAFQWHDVFRIANQAK
jgi:hypothetical protein